MIKTCSKHIKPTFGCPECILSRDAVEKHKIRDETIEKLEGLLDSLAELQHKVESIQEDVSVYLDDISEE